MCLSHTTHLAVIIVVVLEMAAAASAASGSVFSMQDFKQAAQAGKGKVSCICILFN